MNTESQIYRDLQKHLDRLPIGFPATASGVEIRVLKHLFTPEEARIATQLSRTLEPLNRIYERVERTGTSIEELKRVLDHMADKGTILKSTKGDDKYYGNAVLVYGMYEFQVERLTKEFVEDLLQYFDEGFDKELYRTRIPQLRTVPVEKSIPREYHISTYDDIREIVESIDGQIAVANCVCRQAKDVIGESCRQTGLRETCLLFRSLARRYLNWGIARSITKEETFDILRKAEEAGLVLQPANMQRPDGICCCCGDCCGILTTVKKFPRPAELYASNYYAEVIPELCNGCEECIGRCQLEAVTIIDGVATVNLDLCIGCGNCVAICTTNAIRLRKKEEEFLPPKDAATLYENIMSKKRETGHA